MADCSAHVETVEAAPTADRQAMVLVDLIAAAEAAMKAHSDNCPKTDSVVIGREPTADEMAHHDALSDAKDAAAALVRNFPPATIDELVIKARFLTKRIDFGEGDEGLEALAEDLDRLSPSGDDAALLALCREYADAIDRANAVPNEDELGNDQTVAAWDMVRAIETTIARTQANTAAGVRAKAAAITLKSIDYGNGEHDLEGVSGAAIISLLEDVERVGPAPAAHPDARLAWEKAKAAYQAAFAAYDEHEKVDAAHYCAEVIRSLPAWMQAPGLHYPTHARWHDADDVGRDVTLSVAKRRELGPTVDDARKALDARRNEYHRAREAQDAESEQLSDVMFDAERDLLATPAPDAAALAYKRLLAVRMIDDDKFGYDDLGFVAFSLSTYITKRYQVQSDMDLLRIAGVDHPMLHLPAFDPSDWIAEYEAEGGLVSVEPDALLLEFPPEHSQAPKLEAWQFRAVFFEAERRKGEGGDPVFDAHGGFGQTDNRGTARRGRRRYIVQLGYGARVRFVTRDRKPDVVLEPYDTGGLYALTPAGRFGRPNTQPSKSEGRS